MDLNLNTLVEKIEQNDFIKNFLKELGNALENLNKKNKLEGENMEDIKLTDEQERQFDKEQFRFLHDYFEKELKDLSKGEIYLVTDKFQNDNEYHRYKITQYKNNLECKYIAFEKDLPENIKEGDVIRKIDGKYFYDGQATQYIKENIRKIKQEICSKNIAKFCQI